jgi:hypothetical protein
LRILPAHQKLFFKKDIFESLEWLTLSIRRKKSAQIGLKILPVAVHNL